MDVNKWPVEGNEPMGYAIALVIPKEIPKESMAVNGSYKLEIFTVR